MTQYLTSTTQNLYKSVSSSFSIMDAGRQVFLEKCWTVPSSMTSIGNFSIFSIKNGSILLNKIWNITKVIFTVALGLMLFCTNNTLFTVSFFIGIIRHDDVDFSMKKIKAVWETQPFNTLLITGLGSLGGFGSVLSFPMTIAVGSVLYAANLGAYLSKRAQEIQRNSA